MVGVFEDDKSSMKKGKLNVVWICQVSDAQTREHLSFSHFYFKFLLKKFMGRKCEEWNDMFIWVSNAIKEFEKFEDIELTVVFPHKAIKGTIQKFDINGVHYCAFRSEDDYLMPFIKEKVFKCKRSGYPHNREIIKNLLSDIQPDLVHVIGAEIPHYSIAALDIPKNIPSVVSLQTLMSDPSFLDNYPISKEDYLFRSSLETAIIKRCDYIATTVPHFRKIILNMIKPNAIFLDMSLALGQDICIDYVEKEYDFVYFAANISKAADYALEAFALACRLRPGMTLNLSGACSQDYKKTLEDRAKALGVAKQVFITGSQPTHNDVLRHIRKSRFAVIPLKIDMISGTIRESMACGLPVVTTITPITPELNEKRESVLLSEKGDYDAMAMNMVKLYDDSLYADTIRENGIKTIQERYSNESFMRAWRQYYFDIINK